VRHQDSRLSTSTDISCMLTTAAVSHKHTKNSALLFKCEATTRQNRIGLTLQSQIYNANLLPKPFEN